MVDACDEAREEIDALALVTLSFAEAEAETLMPGYTHLQRGQPVTLGHHLLAWVEMLERDHTRFDAAREAATPSPLGAGAVAGSTLGIDRPDGQMRNSIDAVSDRDFALDYLYAAAMLFGHLSRMGEEIVLWSTSEFEFVKLPENASTGSSMMPQKLNPDVAELVRGKAGTRDRPPHRAARDRSRACRSRTTATCRRTRRLSSTARRDVRLGLQGMTVLVSGLEANRDRLAEAVGDPLLLATDVAEELVKGGVPFREAHEQVAGSRARRLVPADRVGGRERRLPGRAGARRRRRGDRGRAQALRRPRRLTARSRRAASRSSHV